MKPNELMAQTVAEFVTGADVFHPTDRASEVIGFMRETKSYEALVEDGDRTSIVTMRDLLDLSNLDTRLSKLMHQVPRLSTLNTVADAASLMYEYRTRSMPVYEGTAISGLVSSPAIVSKLMETEFRVKLSSLMTREPVTIDSSATVASARELMRRKRIDQIPIVEDRRLTGIVTSESVVFGMTPRSDRDAKGGKSEGRFDESLSNYGGGSIVTNEITDSLMAVYLTLNKEKTNYSIIMNTGEIQGIVTYRDFMKLLLRRSQAPQLPVYIVGLPEDPFEAAAVTRKFTEAIQLLRKGFPEISEARAIIKAGAAKSSKRRFQVDVLILSPKERYSYSVFSYAVADAFDQVNSWAKRLFAQRKELRLRSRPKRNPESAQAPR
jgi:CBS domain-containing protein